MKVSLILAAVLSFETAFTFLYAGPQPFKGSGLIARVPGGNRDTQHQTKDGARKIPGYGTKGIKHPDADANNREKVREMVKKGEERVPDTKMDAPVLDHVPEPGQTAIHKETFPDRAPRYTGYMGDDFGDHQDALRYREALYPQSRDAEYRPGSSKGRRALTIGGLPRNNALRGDGPAPDAVHEEKGPASWSLTPVNQKGNIPPTTVVQASEKASRNRDSPMVRKLDGLASADGGTMRIRSNPSKDSRPGPVLPLRGKKVDGYPTPYDEQFDGGDTWLEDSDRSRSPKSDEDRNYRVRDSGRPRRKDPKSDLKRDVVDSALSQESNAESTHPDTSNDFKQEYEQYLQAYSGVQSNATDVLMPIIEEMVDGHNSTLVWDAAWKILSLANPNIIVMGPFSNGLHAFDYYEDLIMNSTNNATMASIIAIDNVLIDLYQTTWNKAYDALNSSGLLHDLEILEQSLISDDPSVADINEDKTTTDSVNDFFLNYLNSALVELSSDNSTSIDNSTSGGNSTSTDPGIMSSTTTATFGSTSTAL